MSNKKLVSKLDSMLEGMISRLEKIESLAIDQLPVLCKEIINLRKVEIQNGAIGSGIGTTLAITMTIILTILSFKESLGDGRILTAVGAIIAGMISLILIGGTIGYLLELRELKAAPKFYVLKELRKMLVGK